MAAQPLRKELHYEEEKNEHTENKKIDGRRGNPRMAILDFLSFFDWLSGHVRNEGFDRHRSE
jgi:hypothetical protein